MKTIVCVIGICLLIPCFSFAAQNLISEATSECIECHITFQPGIVADWQKSRHAATTPAQAMQADELALKVSNNSCTRNPQGYGRGMCRMPHATAG